MPVDLPVDLPIRQAVFVEEYVTDFNGTNAAKRAGYSEKNAHNAASLLRRNPDVVKAIGKRVIERTKGLAVTSEIALAELANAGKSRKWGAFPQIEDVPENAGAFPKTIPLGISHEAVGIPTS